MKCFTLISQKVLKIINFLPSFHNFMKNLENLIKIRRVGDHNKSGGLECLTFLTRMHSLHCKNGKSKKQQENNYLK